MDLGIKTKQAAEISCLFLALSGIAFADTSTPLVDATFSHLLWGNVLIGVLEAALLVFVFKARWLRSITWMVPANFLSAWIGFIFVLGVLGSAWPSDIYTAHYKLWGMFFISYLLTLLVEMPFVARAMQARLRSKRVILAVLVTQTASYLLVFGVLWTKSDATLFSNAKIVAKSEITMPAHLSLYYIDPRTGNAMKQNCDTGERLVLKVLDSHSWDDRLFLWKTTSAQKRVDLYARLREDYNFPAESVLVDKDVATTAPATFLNNYRIPVEDLNQVPDTLVNCGEVRSMNNLPSHWHFYTNYRANRGLSGKNDLTSETIRIAYEVPYDAWSARNATQLSNDSVVFQFGNHQICIFDPTTHRIAKIADGRGPVVVIE